MLTALGAPYWEYLAAHPDQQALFGEQMRQQAQITSLPCVPLVDWPATATVADIAGGIGTVLAAVLRAAPHAHGILVDEPTVLARAGPFLDSQGVADRCALHPGSCSPRHPRRTCTCSPGSCTTGTTTMRPAVRAAAAAR
jgi:hypothetical protein